MNWKKLFVLPWNVNYELSRSWSHTSSYSSSIVTMAVSCIVFEKKARNWSKNVSFHRAMLCIQYSAEYAVGRSVRLSHVGILSKRLNTSSYFFSPSGSHIISTPNDMAIFKRRPPTEGVEFRGMKNITIFDHYLALTRNWYNIEP